MRISVLYQPLEMRTTVTLFACLPLIAAAQSLVSQAPQQRTALLEDFTGIHCGYCPEGHAIAASLKAAHPDDLVVVGVHAGGYAVPGVGEPDFRTTEGTAIDANFTISGYPAGVINRLTFGGLDDLGRGAWEGAVNDVLAMSSNVNLGVSSSFDDGSRDLTVTVELYYTGDSPDPASDYISVFLKESHLDGPQVDYANGNHANYDHTNVLRAYLTDVWGDEQTSTAAGTSVIRTYTYNVPIGFDIANCEVVAFVSEFKTAVYQVREVVADGGNTTVVGQLDANSGTHAGGSDGSATAFNYSFNNLLGAPADYEVSVINNGAPASWGTSFSVNGNTFNTPTVMQLSDMSASDIVVSITPDATPGVGAYLLRVASVNDPMSPVLVRNINVISNVHDLIVSNPQAEPHIPLYETALSYEPFSAGTNRDNFVKFAEAGALGDVLNYYFNVSWTFPSITDDVVDQLAPLMDGGANLMIAGQDIGWDQSGATGSYGTPVTQAFYTSHLLADFVTDGSTATTQVAFVAGDQVFDGVPSSGLNNVFSTNIYPDEITPIAPAVSIMYYNGNAAKIGGLRAQTSNYKVVYFGTGPEQMTNVEVGSRMIGLSHDWFYGVVGVDEFDADLAALLGQAYPSPSNDVVTIPLNSIEQKATLRLMDATGREVLSRLVAPGTTQVSIDVSTLGAGIYVYQLIGVQGNSASRTLQVLH